MLTRPRLRSGNASMIKTTGSFLGTVIMRPIGRTCFGRYSSLASAVSRICCVTSPGPQKARWVIERFGRQPYFYTSVPHTFDKINTAPVLLAHDLVLGPKSEGTDTGLGSFRPFRAAEANTAIF